MWDSIKSFIAKAIAVVVVALVIVAIIALIPGGFSLIIQPLAAMLGVSLATGTAIATAGSVAGAAGIAAFLGAGLAYAVDAEAAGAIIEPVIDGISEVISMVGEKALDTACTLTGPVCDTAKYVFYAGVGLVSVLGATSAYNALSSDSSDA